MPKAIFDNTVFSIAARIPHCDLIALAQNLFSVILIPQEVFREMQQFPHDADAQLFIQKQVRRVGLQSRGLQLCDAFDPVVLASLHGVKGVDKGEAEAVAQAEKRQVPRIFTDDKKCVKALAHLYPHLAFHSTFYLICRLDLAQLLPDYPAVFNDFLTYKPLPLKKADQKKAKSNLREDYAAAMRHLGLPADKKIIARKISFKS